MTENRGLHSRVVHALGSAIVSGEFAEASPLPRQEECYSRFGVSRTVLREALKVLTAKGLVEARPKAGTFVTQKEKWNFLDPDVLDWLMSTEEHDLIIDQLYELRQMVEPTAAYLAASRARLDDFRKIGDAYDAMAQAVGGPDSVGPDLAFHRAIIAATGNDLFVALGQVVESALKVSFRIGAENPEGASNSLQMHKEILDAIVERNGTHARSAMQRLIDYSKKTVMLMRTTDGKKTGKRSRKAKSNESV